MARDKRYTPDQAARLLSRLMGIKDASLPQTRKMFVDLLAAQMGDVVVNPGQVLEREPDERVSGLRKGVYAYLHLALGSRGAKGKWIWPDVRITDVTVTVGGPDHMRVEVSGALNKLLTVQVYNLLRMVGHRIEQCPCGRLFVRVRRQTTCSPRCQKKYYMRKYRAGEVGSQE